VVRDEYLFAKLLFIAPEQLLAIRHNKGFLGSSC